MFLILQLKAGVGSRGLDCGLRIRMRERRQIMKDDWQRTATIPSLSLSLFLSLSLSLHSFTACLHK